MAAPLRPRSNCVALPYDIGITGMCGTAILSSAMRGAPALLP
jgi:hypothetical protein